MIEDAVDRLSLIEIIPRPQGTTFRGMTSATCLAPRRGEEGILGQPQPTGKLPTEEADAAQR